MDCKFSHSKNVFISRIKLDFESQIFSVVTGHHCIYNNNKNMQYRFWFYQELLGSRKLFFMTLLQWKCWEKQQHWDLI